MVLFKLEMNIHTVWLYTIITFCTNTYSDSSNLTKLIKYYLAKILYTILTLT